MILDEVGRASLHEEIAPLLGWDAVDAEVLRQIETIYRSTADDRVPGAIVPVLREDRVWFCALADNRSEWRKLAPLIMAAVGMTLTNFDGRPAEAPAPGQSEPFTSRGLTVTWFKGTADPKKRWDPVSALHRMVRMLQAAPPGVRALPQSPAHLLNRFDLAIQAGDRQSAEDVLIDLERSRGVDAINLRFLRTRWHQAFLQWQELRDEQWFADVARARRPHEVTNQLIHALLDVDLGGLDAPADAGGLLDRFRVTVAPEAGNLFADLTPERSPAVSVMYLLDALDRDDQQRIEQLRSEDRASWDGTKRARFEDLLVLAPTEEPGGPPSVDFEAELDRYLESDDSVSEEQRAALLELQASAEPLTFASVLGALAVAPALPAVAPSAPVRDEPPEALEKSEPALPNDWFEWFDLPEGTPFRAARDRAEHLAATTSVDEQLPDGPRRDLFISSFQELVTADPQRAALALPHLASWLQADERWPSIEMADVYEELLTTFLLSDARSVEALGSMVTVLDGWLAVDPRRAQYADLLAAIRDQFDAFVSEYALDVLIDLAELLVSHSCPDANARVGFWSDLVGRLGALQSRMTAGQVVVLNDLGVAIGVPVGFARPADDEFSTDASPRDWSGLVGLYTLRDDVALRVRDVLAELLPSAELQRNNAHVTTEALTGLAARADVMAVDASAAKHSATAGIKSALGARSPLWVKGGASSMVSAIIGRIGASSAV